MWRHTAYRAAQGVADDLTYTDASFQGWQWTIALQWPSRRALSFGRVDAPPYRPATVVLEPIEEIVDRRGLGHGLDLDRGALNELREECVWLLAPAVHAPGFPRLIQRMAAAGTPPSGEAEPLL